MIRTIFVSVLLLLLAACRNNGEIPTPTNPLTSTPDLAPEATLPFFNEESIFNARVHLAEYLGITPGDILEKDVKVVEWPDASLGCPQPGMMYAQVITPGYKIVFEAGGIDYTYHTDMHGHVVLCEDSSK